MPTVPDHQHNSTSNFFAAAATATAAAATFLSSFFYLPATTSYSRLVDANQQLYTKLIARGLSAKPTKEVAMHTTP